jgi:hypothetical protein
MSKHQREYCQHEVDYPVQAMNLEQVVVSQIVRSSLVRVDVAQLRGHEE